MGLQVSDLFERLGESSGCVDRLFIARFWVANASNEQLLYEHSCGFSFNISNELFWLHGTSVDGATLFCTPS